MASVPSLDKDMRNLRLSKYTPKAAAEVRDWIEASLQEQLPHGDLLESLKDGVALCKLANLALSPPGIKFKTSTMPFVQMENISHFLRASQLPPFGLQPHDMFLTVDLYEGKDPAQVIQCLSAFSRVAHAARPDVFQSTIGPKGKSANGAMSPQNSGRPVVSPKPTSWSRDRGASNASQGSTSVGVPSRTAALSPSLTGGSNESRGTTSTNGIASAKGPVSSWSRKTDEGTTAPAWNISQYGYMGGASQGNQGITFGGRRQITSAGPHIPNMAEKEKRRREQELAEEQARLEAEAAEEAERKRRQIEEEQERIAEEERWAEQTRVQREKERREAEMEKQKWIEQEEKWKAEERRRESEAARSPNSKHHLQRNGSDKLQGQYLSQYRADQARSQPNPELTRIQQLEAELEKARERERAYEEERKGRHLPRKEVEHHDVVTHMRNQENDKASKSRSRSRHRVEKQHHNHDEEWRDEERQYIRDHQSKQPTHRTLHNEVWSEDERHFLKQQWHKQNSTDALNHGTSQQSSPRPLPDPVKASAPSPSVPSVPSPRPLPDPAKYATTSSSSPPKVSSSPAKPITHFPSELTQFSTGAEQHAETSRREASQTKTKAGGWAASSLLEREMENERRRQQEWERGQADTREAAQRGVGVGRKEGTTGEGGSWDVNQYGWVGGDSQNRGAAGIGAGRRQIIGPRPPP